MGRREGEGTYDKATMQWSLHVPVFARTVVQRTPDPVSDHIRTSHMQLDGIGTNTVKGRM